jgi:GNAT superfamily N-acetyltransferase
VPGPDRRRRRVPPGAGRATRARRRAPRSGRAAGADADLSIRRGTARDTPTIVALIRGLADYERLRRHCKATPAGIRRHGFGRTRYFETLICRRGGRPIGLALYFFTFSTFLARPTLYLEDLFVVPEERGRGAGKALLQALARIAAAKGCGRMEWAVLDWNRPSIAFYESLGARLRKDWILTRLTGPALTRLARA